MFAALNVHNGEGLAEAIDGKSDSTDFCGFLDQIDRATDPALETHIVLDNGSKARTTRMRKRVTDCLLLARLR